MEIVTDTLENSLVDPLDFTYKKATNYITDRRSVSFHPSGSNVYHPKTGTRLMKNQITGNDWLDPSTVRIQFGVQNNQPGTTPADLARILYPIGGPWSFISRF